MMKIRFVVALRSRSVATSVTAPAGRVFQAIVKRPSLTSTGRPSAVRLAPASSVPRTRSGSPDGIRGPGESKVISGPFVSTTKRQVLVVLEPGKLPDTLAFSTWAPSFSDEPSKTTRPFEG